MKELKDQLDRMESRLDAIDVTLAKNTVILDEHIRRTEIIEEEMKPVKDHVKLMNFGAKIGSAVLALLLAAKQLGLF